MLKLLLFCVLLPCIGLTQLEQAKKHVALLCSDSLHGRGYVSNGDSLAANYISSEFHQIGLRPLDTDFYQYYSFTVNSFPGAMLLKQGEKILLPGRDYLIDPSSPSLKKLLHPFRIDANILTNKSKLNQAIEKVKLRKEYNSFLLDLTDLPLDSARKLESYSYELANYGPVLELTSQKLTWSVSQQQLSYPIITIKKDQYFNDLPIDCQLEARIYKHTTQNVLGYVPAKSKSKKWLVLTAHYDHLGRMGRETYFPGGNDNASGVAMLLELAAWFKEHPLSKKNILFIAFSGEEAGLLGSRYFTEHPEIPLKNIAFLLNLDIMGSGEEGITVVNGSVFTNEFNKLVSINKEKQLLSQVKSRGKAANSDHYWFTEKGVPAFFIYTMGPNKNYHDIDDTYENLSFNEFSDLTELITTFFQFLN